MQPPWFATEYIPGLTLSEALRLHGGPLPVDSLWRLLRDAADGLRAVHAADMVHRDLKPSNVMLTLDGLTLIDFGVARAADQSRLTRTGMVIGTPAYMAPEQAVADRRLSPAADVFALGSLLLYAANGRPPFGDGSGPDLLYRIVHTDADLGRLPDTDPELSAVVESCLAKDPSQRPTAAELFDRARGHVPAATTSLWPPDVMDRITERAAFAGNPPPAVGPEPESPGPETPQPARGPGSTEPDTPPAEAVGPASRKPRERRTRVLVLALPVVVVVGTTLTIALGPFDGSSEGAGPGPSTPTAVVSPSASAAGGRSPKPTPPASRPPGSQPGSSSSPASPGTPGGGGDDGTGDAGGSAAGGTTGSGGSSGSGDSGSGAGDKPPAQAAPSGTHLLRGASTGRCLADSYSAYSGSSVSNSVCGEPSGNGTTMSYRWTYTPVSGTTFRLVSRGTGRCIESRSYAGIAIVDCNGSEAQAWQITATKSNGHTLRNVADKTCLAMSGSIGFQTTPCNPSEPAQLWRNS
ncbi:protein kinase domain-containing protein [Streptomyces sp. NPDC002867]